MVAAIKLENLSTKKYQNKNSHEIFIKLIDKSSQRTIKLNTFSHIFHEIILLF